MNFWPNKEYTGLKKCFLMFSIVDIKPKRLWHKKKKSNTLVIIKGKGGMGKVEKGKDGQIMVMEEDLTLGWIHKAIYRWCIIETYIILLINITPINLMK